MSAWDAGGGDLVYLQCSIFAHTPQRFMTFLSKLCTLQKLGERQIGRLTTFWAIIFSNNSPLATHKTFIRFSFPEPRTQLFLQPSQTNTVPYQNHVLNSYGSIFLADRAFLFDVVFKSSLNPPHTWPDFTKHISMCISQVVPIDYNQTSFIGKECFIGYLFEIEAIT